MSKQTVLLLQLLVFSSAVAAAPFCAVTGVGSNCWYYDVQSCRQAAGPSGACTVNPNEAKSNSAPSQRSPNFIRSNPAIDSYERARRERSQDRAEDQLRRDMARQNTDPRLLPLVSDVGLSPETQSAIMSALFTALDMNAPGSDREWRNIKTGAFGTVIPQEIAPNMFGEPCREFTISLSLRGETRSTSGTACRKNGQWVWLGG